MRGFEFYKKKDTEEIHVFEGKISGVSANGLTGTTNPTSVCEGAVKAESTLFSGRILTDYEARFYAAAVGVKVCGGCVSHFYKTYP